MDTLIEAAVNKVDHEVNIVQTYQSLPVSQRKILIARAIHAVDALKSALKAIQ